MSSRLSVIFYIILCFEIGVILLILPWVPHGWMGLSDWANNYFLVLAARKAGYGMQRVIASGWVRGAVSGLGILNISMGIWEIINFRKSVGALDAGLTSVKDSNKVSGEPITASESPVVKADPLSDYPRRHRQDDHPGQP
jgi:hypothetical protein